MSEATQAEIQREIDAATVEIGQLFQQVEKKIAYRTRMEVTLKMMERDIPKSTLQQPEVKAQPVARRIAYLDWPERLPTYHSFAIEGPVIRAPRSDWTGVRMNDAERDNVLRMLTEIEKEHGVRFEVGAGGEIYLPPAWRVRTV